MRFMRLYRTPALPISYHMQHRAKPVMSGRRAGVQVPEWRAGGASRSWYLEPPRGGRAQGSLLECHTRERGSRPARGLKQVKFVHFRIPSKIWQRFIVVHNSFHQGAGENFIDYLEESVQLESEWELETTKTGLRSANPRYKTVYKEFVLAKSPSSALSFGKRCHCA